MIRAIGLSGNANFDQLHTVVTQHQRLAVAVTVVSLTAIGIAWAIHHHRPLAEREAPAPFRPVQEIRPFFQRAELAPPEAPLSPAVILYQDITRLLIRHLSLADLSALTRTNRAWYHAVQPQLRELTLVHDRLIFELESARTENLAQVTKRVYFDREMKQFMLFNSLNGHQPHMIELGTITLTAGLPRELRIGDQRVTMLRLASIAFEWNEQVDEQSMQDAVAAFQQQCRRTLPNV